MTSHSRCAKDSVSLPKCVGLLVNASESSEGFFGLSIGRAVMTSHSRCAKDSASILVPRGCDPFGQRHGSRPLAGSNFQSAIHGLPIVLRSLVPLSKWWTRQ